MKSLGCFLIAWCFYLAIFSKSLNFLSYLLLNTSSFSFCPWSALGTPTPWVSSCAWEVQKPQSWCTVKIGVSNTLFTRCMTQICILSQHCPRHNLWKDEDSIERPSPSLRGRNIQRLHSFAANRQSTDAIESRQNSNWKQHRFIHKGIQKAHLSIHFPRYNFPQ